MFRARVALRPRKQPQNLDGALVGHRKLVDLLRAELYGALNHATFSSNYNEFTVYTGLSYTGLAVGAPVATVTADNIASTFSNLINIGGARTIQLGLKLYF